MQIKLRGLGGEVVRDIEVRDDVFGLPMKWRGGAGMDIVY